MNTLANSSFRKPEAKPAERITPHQVLTRSNGMKGDDKRMFTALGYQMMDDVKRLAKLRQLIEADAPKAELLKVIGEAKQ